VVEGIIRVVHDRDGTEHVARGGVGDAVGGLSLLRKAPMIASLVAEVPCGRFASVTATTRASCRNERRSPWLLCACWLPRLLRPRASRSECQPLDSHVVYIVARGPVALVRDLWLRRAAPMHRRMFVSLVRA
jgi:hypothetical protein